MGAGGSGIAIFAKASSKSRMNSSRGSRPPIGSIPRPSSRPPIGAVPRRHFAFSTSQHWQNQAFSVVEHEDKHRGDPHAPRRERSRTPFRASEHERSRALSASEHEDGHGRRASPVASSSSALRHRYEGARWAMEHYFASKRWMSRFCRPLRSLSFCLPVPEYPEDMEAYSSGKDIERLRYSFCRFIQALCFAAHEGTNDNLDGFEHDISRRGMALWWLVLSFYPATASRREIQGLSPRGFLRAPRRSLSK